MVQDYYKTLGISKEASNDEIKKSYRKMAMQYHPDRNKDNPKAEQTFKEVSQAYEILKDAQKRAAYDRFGHAAFESGGGGAGGGGDSQGDFTSAFSDIFEDLFGDFVGRGNRGGSSGGFKGGNSEFGLEISLEEAFMGKEVAVSVPSAVVCKKCKGKGTSKGTDPVNCSQCNGFGKVRMQQGFFTIERTCPACMGRGQVIRDLCKSCSGEGRIRGTRDISIKVPQGIEDGNRIRISGEGEVGVRGGTAGDLYVHISTRRHAIFDRKGDDLVCIVPVKIATVALGGNVEVPTIDGGRSRVTVPVGTQSGKQMRLRGKGMPALRGGRFGDLYVEIVVETPVNLNSKQKALLEEFDKAGSESNNPTSRNFFEKVSRFWGGNT
jgi:molecular chaperone DnaJ